MSRVGKKPIIIPEKTEVIYKDREITVKSKNGTLKKQINTNVDLKIENNTITVIPLDNSKQTNAFQGMTRSLINNMVTGVSEGFKKTIEINGIGYRAEGKGKNIVLNIGFSKPVEYELPEGITAEVDKKNNITLSGIDNELLGMTAAKIRQLRPPEPYKGKGIKYADEYIQRKAGKTGTK